MALRGFCILTLHIQWGKKYLIRCWFCTFAHWQRNDLSIILMVGLFEQWENNRITTKKSRKTQKNTFQKSYKLICILMSQISIWSPINHQDFWLPGVFYTGEDLRLGALSMTPRPPWSNMEVETLCFGGVFLKGTGQLHRIKGTMVGAMYRQGQGTEASQGIENGSWMGIPAWQWPKTHGQGNKGAQEGPGVA